MCVVFRVVFLWFFLWLCECLYYWIVIWINVFVKGLSFFLSFFVFLRMTFENINLTINRRRAQSFLMNCIFDCNQYFELCCNHVIALCHCVINFACATNNSLLTPVSHINTQSVTSRLQDASFYNRSPSCTDTHTHMCVYVCVLVNVLKHWEY